MNWGRDEAEAFETEKNYGYKEAKATKSEKTSRGGWVEVVVSETKN